MEPDPALIEITAEDDSLIRQSPSLADANGFFSCSPIPIAPRLRPPRSSRASPIGNGNKENINVNKSELPKQSVEPKPMKRRKKGSTYNLQKSLAWDKAFFTDEGFLNPSELSMLGESKGDSCKELLPSISEVGRKFLGNSCGRVDSSDLQGTPKVLSNQKGNRSGLKSGCPRSLVFSSLKRPASSSIIKAGLKESKLPKLPVSKKSVQSLHEFSKSHLPSTSQTKQNQIGQEDIQTVASCQSTSKTTRTITSRHTSISHSVSQSTKLPVRHTRRNKVQDNSTEKLISQGDLQPQKPLLANMVNFGLKFPTVARLPTGSHTAAAHEVIMRNGVISENVNFAGIIPQTEVQSNKPSGLRMPSPSLSFFSQFTSSSSHSLSRGTTQLINVPGSCVPKTQRLNTLNCTYNPPHVPEKLLKKLENSLSDGNAEVSDFSSEIMTVKLAENSPLVKEVKVSSCSKSSEVTKDNQEVERQTCSDTGFPESESCGKVDQNIIKQQMDLQRNEHLRLMEDESSDKLKKDDDNLVFDSSDSRCMTMSHLETINLVSQKSCQVLKQGVQEIDDAIHRHHIEGSRPSSSTVHYETISDCQPEGAAGVIKQDSALMMHNDDSNDTHDVDLWKTEKAEPPNPFSGEDDVIIRNSECNDVLLGNISFESPKYKRENFANGNLLSILCESKGSEILGSNALPRTSAEQAYQDASGPCHLCDQCTLANDNSCSLLSERVATNKCERVHGLETSLSVLNPSNITNENQGVRQDDDAVVSNIVEQLQADFFIDSQVRLGRTLETSRDYESVEFFSMRTKEDVRSNDIEHHILPEKAETRGFSGKDYLEKEKTKVVDSKIHHEYHTGDPVRMLHPSLTNLGSAGSCEAVCLPLCTVDVDKNEMSNTTSALCKDPIVQIFNGSNSRQIDSAADNLFSLVSADRDVKSGCLPEVQILSLVPDQICSENPDPCNCILLSEGTSGKNREGKLLPTSLTVQERSDIIQVQLSMDGSNTYVEGTHEKQFMEDEPSGSIHTETLIHHDTHSPDTLFKRDMMLNGLATYTESDMASTAREWQTSGSVNTHEQSCSSGSVNAADTGFDKKKSNSLADIEINNARKNGSLVASYHMEDAKKTLSTKRSVDEGIVGTLAVKLPLDASPFSDEWLAAMEAAGEEILTMKGGAVQNSPTDKTLPEPSPWSPVKRKQNQIGPYDCTKFVNVPPHSD